MTTTLLRLIVLSLPSVASAQTAAVSSETLSASMTASTLRMVGSLLIVLLVLGGTAWLVRRWRERQHPTTKSIEIVSGLSLGAKERVVLLRVGGEQILVGVSPAGMRSLHVIKDAERPFDLAMGAAE